MMFASFTWQQFLIAALVFSVVWWVAVLLLYWRAEVSGLLSGKGWNAVSAKAGASGATADNGPLPHGWQDGVDDLVDSGTDEGLLGKPVLEHGVSVLDAEEFSFVPREEEAGLAGRSGAVEAEPGAENRGDLADVQQEVRSICALLAQEDGTKEDFFALFAMVRERYPKVSASPLLAELNGFIRDRVPFHLSQEELDGLWL